MELNEYARLGGVEVDLKVIAGEEHGGDYTRVLFLAYNLNSPPKFLSAFICAFQRHQRSDF